MLHLSAALTAYILTLSAVLGAVMGSFAACAAGRFAAGEDVLHGRSHCDGCGHTLGARDLVPVLSWLFLKGRCRYCGAPIPARCPLTELLCAAAFAALVWHGDVTVKTAQLLLLTVFLLIVALADYDTGLIPDGALIGIFAVWFAFAPFLNGGALWDNVKGGLLSAVAASAPLLLLSLVMDKVLGRESMGGGDLKLFFVAGLFFPLREILYLLIVSCVLGIVFSLVTGKTTGDAENPKAFPFGPAIAAGAYLSLLTADAAVTAYLSLF